MPDRALLCLLCSVFIVLGGGTAHAQRFPRETRQDTAPTEAEPQSKAPKKLSVIIIADDRLSIDFVDFSFGAGLQAIGQKAGFRVEGSGNFFGKKVTTKFNDLDIASGLIRLFSLVQESNYLIDYDAKGRISRVKIFAPETDGTSDQPSALPTYRRVPPRSRLAAPAAPAPPIARPVPHIPQIPQGSPAPQVSQPENPEPGEITDGEDQAVESVTEIPLKPPQRRPVYIPPVRP
jgi:hypothetical protein